QNQIEHLFTYMGHCRSVDCVDVRQDLVATGSYDHMLKIWSAASGADEASSSTKANRLRSPVITLEGHKEAISGCAWLDDTEEGVTATVATASMDTTI